jgi:hypothetical protein
MPKYIKPKVGFNRTQIKDGHIVRVSKDGRIKAILDKYPPEKAK